MREIKFRAWHKENKEMSFHPSLIFNFNTGILESIRHIDWEGDCEPEDWTPRVDGNIDPEEVVFMQYTGLKDKNGKEIYEGDILESVSYRYNQATDKHDIEHNRYREGVVVFGVNEINTGCGGHGMGNDSFSSPMFYLKGKYSSKQLISGLRVIGNIYESPELLKE